MTQLYAQPSQQGIWMALGPPTSAAFALGQPLTVTYGDGSQDTLSAHVPAVTSAGTTQVDRTGAVWLLYVVHGDPTLRIVREMDQGTIAGSYAPLARVLADRVVPYQPDSGQAQSSTAGQSFLPLSVTNNSSTQSIGGSTTVPVPIGSTDYVVQCALAGSTASAVWNALADKTGASDLQVLFAGAEIDADIDQQTNGAWSASNITCSFRLQRPIAASASDQGYQLRMGGGLRSSPPRSWANIYPDSDDFGGSSLDSSKWVTAAHAPATGSASVASSVLSLVHNGGTTNGYGVVGQSSYGAGYALLARAQLAVGSLGEYRAVRWGTSIDGVPCVFAEAALDYGGTDIVGEINNGSGGVASTSSALSTDSAYHAWGVARDAVGLAYVWRDAQAPQQISASVSASGALLPVLHTANATASALVLLVDWVKVRPFCSPEPTVAAGTLQSAGALVWQPITDSTGSVLVDSAGNPIMALTSL